MTERDIIDDDLGVPIGLEIGSATAICLSGVSCPPLTRRAPRRPAPPASLSGSSSRGNSRPRHPREQRRGTATQQNIMATLPLSFENKDERRSTVSRLDMVNLPRSIPALVDSVILHMGQRGGGLFCPPSNTAGFVDFRYRRKVIFLLPMSFSGEGGYEIPNREAG